MGSTIPDTPYHPDRGDCAMPAILPPRVASYRCLKCCVEWRAVAGPANCPACGHPYVDWLDAAGTAQR
jgi:hypothetical protein